MTELLYLRDAGLREFDATVTAVDSGGSRAALDRTVFYATGGEQPHDMGTLGGALVTNVHKERGCVAHPRWRPLYTIPRKWRSHCSSGLLSETEHQRRSA
ncbi:MAG TPA: hypothetical protein VJM33_11840 [Microthrixaceae bacterium]|nr:hypothetical protein [Microthrixaceae bacterium]